MVNGSESVTENMDSEDNGFVPCCGCTACCQFGDMPKLQPELFPEDIGKYDEIERDGKIYLQLKANGDCIYLGPEGCTIHETRPQACRPFDCISLIGIVIELPAALDVIPPRIMQAAQERSGRGNVS